MIYRPSPLFRFLPVFGSLAFLAFAALGVVVAVVEDAAMGWWAGRWRWDERTSHSFVPVLNCGPFKVRFKQISFLNSTNRIAIHPVGKER